MRPEGHFPQGLKVHLDEYPDRVDAQAADRLDLDYRTLRRVSIASRMPTNSNFAP
jgi:hypothetical protein